MRKGRYFKKRDASLKGSGYDSLFEKEMHETVLADCQFHLKESKVEYSIIHSYEPDFTYEKDGKTFLLETKGRFHDSAEAAKYVWIRKVLPENTELIFIWEKAGTAFPFSKRRKDGTRMTSDEWATKNGFRHWNRTNFSLDLL